MRLHVGFVVAAVSVGVVACNGILGIDNYRACSGAECDGGVASEAGNDAGNEAAPTACTQSSDCPSASPVCSASVCRGVRALSRGMSSFQCAVLDDGTARCWGVCDVGQLGDGQPHTGYVAKPVTVMNGSQPLGSIVQIATGISYGCALTQEGNVYCWGAEFPTSNGPTLVRNNVQRIAGGAGVANGTGSVCAVQNDNSIACWGVNGWARLGCTLQNQDAGCTTTPAAATASAPILLGPGSAVAAGTYQTCSFVAGQGNFTCWGDNLSGELGNGTNSATCCAMSTSSLSQSIGPYSMSAIAGSDEYTVASSNNGWWFAWGIGLGGAILGVAPNGSTPTPTKQNKVQGEWHVLEPGWYHACAVVASDASVVCWGQDDHGQMGNGTISPQNNQPKYVTSPVAVSTLSGVRDLAAHRNFTCAINGDGQVYCWGQNTVDTNGPWLLGAGTTSADVTTPQVVKWD